MAISCWIGDIKRSANAKKLVSYFGIAPEVRQSTNRESHGHIRKEGIGMVRWLLPQAALVGIRMSKGPGRGQYLGVSRRRGKKIARIAVARKLLGTVYHMTKEEIDHEEFLRRGSNAQGARSRRWSKVTDELIGQLRLSRGCRRNRRRSDHALVEARRDVWVATRTVIEECDGAR